MRTLWSLEPPRPVDASYPLFALYTSGSTGKPKGIVHVHGGSQVGLIATSKIVFDAQPERDTLFVIATPGWITGQSYMIAASLLCRTPSMPDGPCSTGGLKRGDDGSTQDDVLLHAIRNMNLPKFIAQDMPHFNARPQHVQGAVLDAPSLSLAVPPALTFRGRHCPWRVLSPSLLGVPLGPTDQGLIFLATITEPLITIVADHVVQRRIVFPGTSYLEVARAASVHASNGSTQSGALAQAVVLSPLFADPAGGLSMDVALFENKQLEIGSGVRPRRARPPQRSPARTRARAATVTAAPFTSALTTIPPPVVPLLFVCRSALWPPQPQPPWCARTGLPCTSAARWRDRVLPRTGW